MTRQPEVAIRAQAVTGGVTDVNLRIPFGDALLVALAAAIGYGFDAYAVNIFGILGPIIAKDLNITLATIGLISSIFLVGYTIGTFVFGILADRIGRRDALGWSIIVYGVATALGGLTTNLFAFTALRFLTGVGGAGELVVGAPYTAEMWPAKHRALGTGEIMFSLYSVGYIVAALAAFVIVPRFGWQAAFIFAIVPALLVFGLRRLVHESVRSKSPNRSWNNTRKSGAHYARARVSGPYLGRGAASSSAGCSTPQTLAGTGASRSS